MNTRKLLTAALMLYLVSNACAVKVGVIVEFPDGEVIDRCVTVEENENGYEVLQKTGLSIEWSYHELWGHGLCKIRDTGCPGDDCWCSSSYWNFYIADNGDWEYSPTGFDSGNSCSEHYCAQEGDILGFAYGDYGTEPAYIKHREICEKRKKRTFIISAPEEIHAGEEINIKVFDEEGGEGIKDAQVEVF